MKFEDLWDAFDFVSFDSGFGNEAYMNKGTGEIFWSSDFADDEFDALPEDIDDEKYIQIPDKLELGLGKNVSLNFAYQYLPQDVDEVESIFRRKGAYARFKALLESKGLLEQWYEFESQAEEKALRQWCEIHGIEIDG